MNINLQTKNIIKSPNWLDDVRSILTLATPLIISQCAQSGIFFIDALLMGQLGPQALAAGALAISAFYLCYILSFGVISAAGNLVAIYHGAGRRRDIVSAIRCGLLLALLLSLGMGILLWNVTPLMLMLGQPPQTVEVAQKFLHILVWGMPFGLLFLALRGFTAGIGKPGPIPFIMFSALILSGSLGWILSQMMGIYGIAIASIITYGYMGIAFVVILCLHRHYKRYPIFTRFTRKDLSIMPELLKIGIPTAGTLGLENSLFNGCAWLMGALGAITLAAHQSLMQLVIASFTVPLGLMYAVSMRAGQASGAGNWHKVRNLSWIGNTLILLWSLFTISVLLLIPNELLSLFLPSDINQATEAKNIALMLVPFAALLCLLDGWQTMVCGLLRALKDAQITVIISGVSYWGIGLPLAWWLSQYSLGPAGIWWGMCSGLFIACFIMQIRLQVLLRKRIHTSAHFLK
ncbi:MATE family efflux transporter [Xenorhabdus vietnamensis]|uniref:MATE family efflux transporter n=1 Tax=Xenorhabdus vietnamensis TaxID=351656 RepID=UPI00142D9838|nr:MATE family efflux transporter [Xenorhabdus vietnamensis]